MNEIIEFFFIGYAGEKNARRKPIDISDLQTRWPEATPILMVNRPKESAPYPATTTVEGSVLYWEVAEIDVAKSGFGQAQVFMRDSDGNVLGKSAVMNTLVKTSLNGTEQENPPPALETWIAKFLEAYEGLGGGNNSGGGSSVSIDTTLTQSGKAADAKVTGDALNELKEANVKQDTEIGKKANDADLADVAKSGSYNDLANKPTIPTVPTALKNPNKLTFKGAVTAEYDGSTAVEVTIPEGGGSSGGSSAMPTKLVWETLAEGTIPVDTTANAGVDTGLSFSVINEYAAYLVGYECSSSIDIGICIGKKATYDQLRIAQGKSKGWIVMRKVAAKSYIIDSSDRQGVKKLPNRSVNWTWQDNAATEGYSEIYTEDLPNPDAVNLWIMNQAVVTNEVSWIVQGLSEVFE